MTTASGEKFPGSYIYSVTNVLKYPIFCHNFLFQMFQKITDLLLFCLFANMCGLLADGFVKKTILQYNDRKNTRFLHIHNELKAKCSKNCDLAICKHFSQI